MTSRQYASPTFCIDSRTRSTTGSRRWWLCLVMFAVISLGHAAIPDSERAVLTALYNQTSGSNWTNNTNWNGAPGTECTWLGIACDSQQAHVISIDLHDNHLMGSLPPLDDLSELQIITLYTTESEFFGCDNLSFNTCNMLTGNIPSLAKLTALQSFNIGGNSFRGAIPPLTGLHNLQTFMAAHNALSGPIPALEGLTSLLDFDVSANQITGSVPSLSGLTNLQQFDAESNQLSGSVPAFNELPNLTFFNVCTNQLTGSLPTLSGLTNLAYFYACNNQLTGATPTLGGLVNLVEFDITGNQLSGSIPNIAGLKGLSLFAVGNNQLSGSISPLPQALTRFSANNNQLNGSIPSLNGLKSLVIFDVRNNLLTGSIPSLVGLTNLQSFEASNNLLNGSIPSFTGLSYLYEVDVSNNQLTGSLPAFSDATGLSQFFASNNRLTGSIPTLNENNWLFFDVSNNQLSGSIPSLTGVAQLLIFNVGFNRLTGMIPLDIVINPFNPFSAWSLCPNMLTHSTSADWDTVTRVSPWYRDCSTSFANLDQVGLTGTWYSPPTSGQGFGLQIFPDLLGQGQGFLSAGWLTFSGETEPFGQRWYSLQGAVDSSNDKATVAIAAPAFAGNFNASPRVPAERVGIATIAFSDCTHGTLSYTFFDSITDTGTIPLTRLTPNMNCTTQGGNGVTGSSSLLSGNWYDPATSGQGLVFDFAPSANALFATWFTYESTAAVGADQTFRNERWYTLQSSSFSEGTTSLDGVPILYATGGLFDTPTETTAVQVGTADIAFQSCTAMTLKYNFTSGENNGQSGTINLVRLGPAPVGCSL